MTNTTLHLQLANPAVSAVTARATVAATAVRAGLPPLAADRAGDAVGQAVRDMVAEVRMELATRALVVAIRSTAPETLLERLAPHRPERRGDEVVVRFATGDLRALP